jgi:hypothetical protein
MGTALLHIRNHTRVSDFTRDPREGKVRVVALGKGQVMIDHVWFIGFGFLKTYDVSVKGVKQLLKGPLLGRLIVFFQGPKTINIKSDNSHPKFELAGVLHSSQMRISEVTEDRYGHEAEAYEDYEDDDEYITEDEDEIVAPSKAGFMDNLKSSLSPSNLKKRWNAGSLMTGGKSAAKVAGNIAWILCTSTLLVGFPILYAYDREKNAAAQSGQLMPLDGQ